MAKTPEYKMNPAHVATLLVPCIIVSVSLFVNNQSVKIFGGAKMKNDMHWYVHTSPNSSTSSLSYMHMYNIKANTRGMISPKALKATKVKARVQVLKAMLGTITGAILM